MKKIEEFMELLTDELAGFDGSVKKLETLCKQLDTIKVKADSSNVEYHIREFLRKQEHTTERMEKRIDAQQTKIEACRGLPEWLLTLYAIGMLLPLFSIGYFGYQGYGLQGQKRKAFEQGQQHIIDHFGSYFEDHPEAYEPYKIWKERDSVVPIER